MDFKKAIRKMQSQSRATNSGTIIKLVDTITDELVVLNSRITNLEDIQKCYKDESPETEKSSVEESAPAVLNGPMTDPEGSSPIKKNLSETPKAKKGTTQKAKRDGD